MRFLPPLSLLLACAPEAPARMAQEPDAFVRAPDLVGREWLNTDRPLASWKEDLRGQVVLLDFWTYCCINCMHILPDLERLEEEFREEPFLVIGVHSAKFEQESDPRNIREAMKRYHIRHPVVVDENMRIWRSFAVRAWPTLVLVDPEGRVVRQLSGEGHYETLRAEIRSLLDRHREKGNLAPAPLRPRLEETPSGRLRYPGKLRFHEGRLYVSNSSGHEVLEVDPASGRILRAFGALGESGLRDGTPAEARFHNPQGLAVLGGALYVADTDNHALRRIDLSSGRVETVAGTGAQARGRPREGPAREQELNSPWALEPDGGRLHVAMAGCHQLWTFDPATGRIELLAGSGWENIVDGRARPQGPLTRLSLRASAALAQPSGLALQGRRLWFADSEVSALRYVDLDAGRVVTLFGTGLFDFGDRDGGPGEVLLQHPLGVAVHGRHLLVADTYNNKIKRVDPEAPSCESLYGSGEPEPSAGGGLSFWEPGGLDVAGDTLYVADTNHHRIVAVDLRSGAWRVLLPTAEPGGED